MDIEHVARVVAMVEHSQVHKISIAQNGQTLTVINNQTPTARSALSDRTPSGEPLSTQIDAPYVGKVQLSPDAAMPPLINQGDHIHQGQTLGFIEQCARLLPIISDKSGRVTEILIKNGQDVEYGQALFRITSQS